MERVRSAGVGTLAALLAASRVRDGAARSQAAEERARRETVVSPERPSPASKTGAATARCPFLMRPTSAE